VLCFKKKKIVLTNSIIKGHEIKKKNLKEHPYVVSTKDMSFKFAIRLLCVLHSLNFFI